MTGEVISVHIGQAGVQTGNACWDQMSLEHGVTADGMLTSDLEANDKFHNFFSERRAGMYAPRALFVDLEPNAIDQVRTGKYKNLYNPEQLVTSNESCANNYGRGYNTIGKEIINLVAERIRRMAESSSNPQGFLVYRSYGGGTGSGFTSLLMERLDVDFEKKLIFEFAVYPSPRLASGVVEPYNSVLTTHATLDRSNCTFVLDNEAIYDICRRNLDIGRPSYANLNRLIGHVVSSITSTLRFDGQLNGSLDRMMSDLVPIPRLHFPLTMYAPVTCVSQPSTGPITETDLTNACFESSNQMVKCDTSLGKYMANSLVCRGDADLTAMNSAASSIRTNGNIKFTDWCPRDIKCDVINDKPHFDSEGDLATTSRTACMMGNNTAIFQAFEKLNKKFDLMFRKKAFIHWYLEEGMEEGQFSEAREDLAHLENDFQEAERKP